jgi:hypothetical protein
VDVTRCCCAPSNQFTDVIRGYPLLPEPEVFGLHDNADITCQQAAAYDLLGTLLSLQPRSGGSAATGREQAVARIARDILDKVSFIKSHKAPVPRLCGANHVHGTCK